MLRLGAMTLLALLVGGTAAGQTPDSDAVRIFRDRILPIARSDQKSSCTECHFGGVDLRMLIGDDPASTFAALRDQGWIDPARPDQSKLLQFIARRPDKEDPVMARVRQAEYEAFRAWIVAAASDPKFLATKLPSSSIGIELPPEVIRHARKDRVIQAMIDTVWTEMGRCVGCHSPEKNQRLVEKHGERMSWLRPHDPEGTLRWWVEHGLIDVDSPDKSLIRLKPLATEVEHGGGPKFVAGSRTDQQFLRFLNDFAAVLANRYRSSEQLPAPLAEVTRPTDQHLRIEGLPSQWDRFLLRVDLFRWTGGNWSEARWATADNPIVGKRRIWQSMVVATAPAASPRAEHWKTQELVRLPPGRYLARIYVSRPDDKGGYSQAHLVAEQVLEGEWPPGYQPPKILTWQSDRPAHTEGQ